MGCLVQISRDLARAHLDPNLILNQQPARAQPREL